MLVQFTVENFRSFDKKTVFNLTATGSDTQHPDHIIAEGIGKAPPLLRSAAIYGANAAGKSNLAMAVDFARNLILRGTRSGMSIPVVPFRLGSQEARPSRFEFIFAYDDVLYSYGFVLDSKRILEEWLYATPKRQEVALFERVTSESDEVQVNFGASLTGKSKEERLFLEFVARGTRHNQLFLTEADDRNVKQLKSVIDWFKEVLLVIPAEAQDQDLEGSVHKNLRLTEFINTFLSVAGTGVAGLTTEEKDVDFASFFPTMFQYIRDQISDDVRDQILDGLHLGGFKKDQSSVLVEPIVLLKMQHRTEDGNLVEFMMDEESDGTQRLVHLAPTLFKLKSEQEQVIILDELDRRLHPLLSRLILETALDCKQPGKKSQFIFTTHETSLLDLDLLRRDEIWFVEKDRCGASHLYSLAEFKIRPDLAVQKGYLNGRFGAIPFIGNLCDLGWMEGEADPASNGTEQA